MVKRASKSTRVLGESSTSLNVVDAKVAAVSGESTSPYRVARNVAPNVRRFQLIAALNLFFGSPCSNVSTLTRSNNTGGGFKAANCGVVGTRWTSVLFQFAVTVKSNLPSASVSSG